VLEAQASGLPVIVTNIGGPKELVKNKINGLIVKPEAKTFNWAIDFLTKNRQQCQRLGQNARLTGEKRNWDKAFNELFKIYQQVCNKLKN
jgi:glycosyltransferase involved in cell wall biosynthesis